MRRGRLIAAAGVLGVVAGGVGWVVQDHSEPVRPAHTVGNATVIFRGTADGEAWRIEAIRHTTDGVCVVALDEDDKMISGGCGMDLYPGSGYSPQVGYLPRSRKVIVFGPVPESAAAVDIALEPDAHVRVPAVKRSGFDVKFFFYVGEPAQDVGPTKVVP